MLPRTLSHVIVFGGWQRRCRRGKTGRQPEEALHPDHQRHELCADAIWRFRLSSAVEPAWISDRQPFSSVNEPPRPITWDLIKQYNCLVILDLPPDEQDTENWATSWGKFPPYKKEMLPLLDAYLKQGGGIFFMPTMWDWGFRGNTKFEEYLKRWGARLPYESVQDPATVTTHPRNTVPFVYTENIAKSPVSDGVKGMWFPGGDWMSYWTLPGTPLLVSKDWTEVVRGSDTSFTKDPHLFRNWIRWRSVITSSGPGGRIPRPRPRSMRSASRARGAWR